MIDTHVHLDDVQFSESLSLDLVDWQKMGVSDFIVPAISASNWQSVLDLSSQYQSIHAALGIHPWYVRQSASDDLKRLEEFLTNANVVAIGEAGLDRLKPDFDLQLEFCQAQMQIAQRLNLPIILHCVKAESDLLGLLNTFSVTAVVHGWGGNKQQAHSLLSHDVYFGLGGALSFANRKKLRASLEVIPLERILLETDAPAMPHFGEGINHPGFIPANALLVANHFQCSVEDVDRVTSATARAVFGL